jgi:hypothetical protein
LREEFYEYQTSGRTRSPGNGQYPGTTYERA